MKRPFSARGLVAALALMTGLAPVCRPDTYVVKGDVWNEKTV